MVDEVTNLSQRRSKIKHRSAEGPGVVVNIFEPQRTRQQTVDTSHIAQAQLPNYPNYAEKPAQNSSKAFTQAAGTDQKKLLAAQNIEHQIFELEKDIAWLIKVSDGGSPVIPRLRDLSRTLRGIAHLLRE